MRRVLIAIAILVVTALPSFAADASGPDPGGNCPDKRGAGGPMMQHHPEMKQEMMRSPQHLLMMAYHKNVMIFGQALAKVARQGETVPREFARTAIAEMRRSVEELEKYRAEAMPNMPAGTKERGEMQRMMDQHLVDVKTHLRQLEELTRSDRIPSQEVLRHLNSIFEGCDRMGCGQMHGGGMHCGEMHGKGGCGCGEKMGMMPAGGPQMMHDLVQKMKAQDADMARQVENMRQAPRDKKVDIMAGIVTQLVQQRHDLTAHMEKMQHHMMHRDRGMHPGIQHGCAEGAQVPPPPPGTPMFRNGEGPDEEPDMDMDDMDMDEVE
jgi:hypothetical protein